MRRIDRPSGQTGFTLVEVVVALLLLGVALLGEASLLLATLHQSRLALDRAQTELLASALTERLRANPAGAADGAYVTDEHAPDQSTSDCRQPCAAATLARVQLAQFHTRLQETLPGAKLNLQCADAGCAPGHALELRLDWPVGEEQEGCRAGTACLHLELLP